MKSRVLIILNNSNICTEMQSALCEATMIVDTAFSPAEAIDLFLRYEYSLILLDVDTDGKAIIKPLRAITSVPILALCSPNDPMERCNILRAGASVCLTKPINLWECVAQVEALLNLYFATSKEKTIRTIAYGTEFVIDPDFRTVFLKGKLVKLSRREFDLLLFLASHDKQVFSRQQLYEQVWGYDQYSSVDDVVRACVKHIRRKLGPAGRDYVQTVRGVGYRFSANPLIYQQL